MSDELDTIKSEHETANGSEVTVTRYGIGAVAFEERMGEYVLRYEGESVAQVLELMAELEALRKRKREEKKAQ
jgi:DNA polymerase III delta subunit